MNLTCHSNWSHDQLTITETDMRAAYTVTNWIQEYQSELIFRNTSLVTLTLTLTLTLQQDLESLFGDFIRHLLLIVVGT